MWDYTPPPKPFYRRAWFFVPVGFIAAVLLVALVWGLAEKERWTQRARAFDYSKLEQMESASIIYDRAGAVLGRIFIQNRDQVPLEEISPAMITAVVAAEDARFYQHEGVDYIGIVRAMVKNYQSGRTRQGASTLTQQLARNSFPEGLPASDRGYGRKVLEMFVAREIERRCDKRKILELYLNRVFFGSGFYGVEAASRGYFGKNAKDLTLSEAAMLAGLLKSPSNLSPWRNRQACVEQRNYVLQRALELEMITKEQHDLTINEDIVVKNRRPIHKDSYAADLVAQQVEKLVGRDAAVSDGYRIYTTIDSVLQKKTESALRDQLTAIERREGYEHQTYAQYDAQWKARARRPASATGEATPIASPEYLQGAAVVLNNANGAILALVGGRDIQHSPYNRSVQARRPPGTAFKPFVYAAAFEKGLFPGTVVQDAVIDNRQVMIGGTTGILGEWGPERVDNKYEGAISARTALVRSKNAASVRFGMMTGLDRVLALAKNAGIESPLRPFPATYLGSSEVTMMELALANTIFPNGGWRPSAPFIIERVEDNSGTVVFQAKPGKQRVLRPATAYQVHTCLAEVLERGTADRAYTELGLKQFPLGGKTGTAYNFTDTWFLGYSSEVTCGIWAGFDKPRPIYRGAFSNEVTLPVWAEVMKATFSDYRPKEIVQPKGITKCEICASSGLLATESCFETVENKDSGEKIQRRTTYFEMATPDQVPKNPCDVHGDAPKSFVKVIPGEQWPRAALAVDVSSHKPVQMKAQTVIGGTDPYNSVQAVKNVVAAKALDGKRAPMQSSSNVPAPAAGEPGDEMEVRRAEPVRPVDQLNSQEPPLNLEPPAAIEF
ncbi:MAG TPA: PBP1A family penicillin-binding protein [Chthoniobacteraceae bacterium]|jgi:penicillin-binding protein 1A